MREKIEVWLERIGVWWLRTVGAKCAVCRKPYHAGECKVDLRPLMRASKESAEAIRRLGVVANAAGISTAEFAEAWRPFEKLWDEWRKEKR
jgi:hypothetical protein